MLVCLEKAACITAITKEFFCGHTSVCCNPKAWCFSERTVASAIINKMGLRLASRGSWRDCINVEALSKPVQAMFMP